MLLTSPDEGRWQHYYRREIQPVLHQLPFDLTFLLLASTLLLIAKRYLASSRLAEFPAIGGRWGEVRWFIYAAFCAGLGSSGLVIFALRKRWAGLGWEQRPRPWGKALLLLIAAGGLALATGHGVAGLNFLLRPEYERIGWFLLSFGWLFVPAVAFVLTVLPGGLSEYGFTWGRVRFWLPVGGLWAGLMAGIIFLASRWTSFATYYPMYRQSYPGYVPQRDGWGFFLSYEWAYGLYFFAWEFFFRGFLLFGLERHYRAQAILLQMVPFALMHIGKPTGEVFSSVIAGLALGWLALRGRSFVPCFLLHWACAAFMDGCAVLGRG
ncbi:MAG TPA: CPBP family intramembrane metalloprotease [Armatimonadetes bacterium]|nr:CPBP family intramembrane metalloprotease [Armatimonadota bacterium]